MAQLIEPDGTENISLPVATAIALSLHTVFLRMIVLTRLWHSCALLSVTMNAPAPKCAQVEDFAPYPRRIRNPGDAPAL
jgi:hypothetical protein